jgi:hypothetical protein
MDDPRVTHVAVEFLRGRYFDCELDAWRAARRLVREMDLMDAEETERVTRTEYRGRPRYH